MKKSKTLLYVGIAWLVLLLAASPSFVHAQSLSVVQNPVYNTAIINGFDIEPSAGQHWSVTDGYAIFTFFINVHGDIVYSTSYAGAPLQGASPKINTFLSARSVAFNLTTAPFTLTQGVLNNPSCSPEQNNPPQHQCLGTSFIFDAVFVSSTNATGLANRIGIIELLDPLYVDPATGFHYFIPSVVFNQTLGVYFVNTDGNPSRLSAINLPDGNVLVGTSEWLGGSSFAANLYFFNRGTQPCGVGDASCMPYFNKIAGFASSNQFTTLQPEYVAPFAYYVVGQNGQVSGVGNQNLKIYQASKANAWVPNGTQIVNNVLAPNKFAVSADPTHLYVAGELGGQIGNPTNVLFVETMTAPLNQMSASVFQVDEVNRLGSILAIPYGGPHNEIYLATHMFSTGVHFYFDYTKTVSGSNRTLLGLAYSTDGGVLWAEQDGYDIDSRGSSFNVISPPSLTGLARTPFNYNNEWDSLIFVGRGPNPNYTNFIVDYLDVLLPSVVSVVTATTSTNFRFALTFSSTTTVTTGDFTLQGDLITPWIMLTVVFISAGAFSVVGYFLGGGRTGVVLMVIGVGVGLMAGIVYGTWPSWTLIFVVLGLIAALWHGGGSSGGGEVQQ